MTNPSLSRISLVWLMLALLFMGALNGAKTASPANFFLAAESFPTHAPSTLSFQEEFSFTRQSVSDAPAVAEGAYTGDILERVGLAYAKWKDGNATKGGTAATGEVPAAGSIRNVNPTGGDMNCVNCVISTDATLRGNPTSALPSGPTSITVLEQQFGSKFTSATTTSIENSLLTRGNGATGVVYGFPPAGSDVGHVFNVVNQNGVIRYLDGQTGTVANPAAFPKLLFMPVKSIGAP